MKITNPHHRLNLILLLGAVADWLLPIPPGLGFGIGLAVALRPYFVYPVVSVAYVPVATVFVYMAVYLAAYVLNEKELALTMKSALMSYKLMMLVGGGFVAAFILHYVTLMLMNISRYPGCMSAVLSGLVGAAAGLITTFVTLELSVEDNLPSLGPFVPLIYQVLVGNMLLLQMRKIVKGYSE